MKLENGPFLASGVPNLGLNDLTINIQAASSELNTNSRLRLQTEFITSESWKQIGLAHTWVTNKNYLKQVIIVIFSSVSSHYQLSHATFTLLTLLQRMEATERQRERDGGVVFSFSMNLLVLWVGNGGDCCLSVSCALLGWTPRKVGANAYKYNLTQLIN